MSIAVVSKRVVVTIGFGIAVLRDIDSHRSPNVPRWRARGQMLPGKQRSRRNGCRKLLSLFQDELDGSLLVVRRVIILR